MEKKAIFTKANISSDQLLQLKKDSESPDFAGKRRKVKARLLADKYKFTARSMETYLALTEFPEDVLQKVKEEKISINSLTFLATMSPIKVPLGRKTFIAREAAKKGWTKIHLRQLRDLLFKKKSLAEAIAIVEGRIPDERHVSQAELRTWTDYIQKLSNLGKDFGTTLNMIISMAPKSVLHQGAVIQALYIEAHRLRAVIRMSQQTLDAVINEFDLQIKSHMEERSDLGSNHNEEPVMVDAASFTVAEGKEKSDGQGDTGD